jgi:hypothetical protein
MMFKRFLVAVAICLFVASTAATVNAQEGKAPDQAGQARIRVPVTNFDYGYVPQGAKISHVYWLYNDGEDTLLIRDVKPG